MDYDPYKLTNLDLLVRIELLQSDMDRLRPFVAEEKAKQDKLFSEQAACRVVAKERGLLNQDFELTHVGALLGHHEDPRLLKQRAETNGDARERLRRGDPIFHGSDRLLS